MDRAAKRLRPLENKNIEEVCPPEKIIDGPLLNHKDEMSNATVHFLKTESVEVAPLGIVKKPLSKLHLPKKPAEPSNPENEKS